MNDALLTSLLAALEGSPNDLPLRLHVAELLARAGRHQEAVGQAATALSLDPHCAEARELMTRLLMPDQAPPTAPAPSSPASDPALEGGPTGSSTGSTTGPSTGSSTGPAAFDWHQAESDLGEVVGPMFVDGSTGERLAAPYDVERDGLSLADVGGLESVKKRLEASFLAPLRNPELRALYGKSLRGGLLLYGPPGCGKTFLAKAVAGELGAGFLHVSLADILDMYVGQSERNLAELFATARESTPCVLFFDELDAIGQKRSQTRNSGMRTTVNQLLSELDGVGSDNEGVYVLAATNAPWDVDPALRRPGRLDRTLLVLPPDRPAREAILKTHLRERPIERVDLSVLSKLTEGFSGADLAHLCESASEYALLDSVATGVPRMIGMADFEKALGDVRPSIGAWVETARNVALFANAHGEYDELARFVRKFRG